MEDENGNEWMEGAVPGGLEIAEVMLEVLDEKGWGATWMDCDGLRICPRVRVWLDGYQDWDYEQVFLLKVWTETEPASDGRTLTVTDHLAVYRRHCGTSEVDVEWRNDPRLFFDADGDWSNDGLHWWVDTCEAMRESVHRPRLSADQRERIAEHNANIERREQELARTMGLHLPYLTDRTTECRVRGHDWLDEEERPVRYVKMTGIYHCGRCGTELTINRDGSRHYHRSRT